MKQLFLTMTPRLQPGRTVASPARGLLCPLLGVLLLLLGWGSVAPARAAEITISTAVPGPINVLAGETLTIADGGSVTSTGINWGVSVQQGGTLNIEPGGSVSSEGHAVIIHSGTLNMTGGSVTGASVALQVSDRAIISGGSLHGGSAGVLNDVEGTTSILGGSVSGGQSVDLRGGTVTISGGSVTNAVLWSDCRLDITGGSLTGGVQLNRDSGRLDITGGSVTGGLSNVWGGTVTVSGCGLTTANGVLTGTLQDRTLINTPVAGPISLVGPTTPPSITLAGANPLTVECHPPASQVPGFIDPGATALDACGDSRTVTASGSVDADTPGSYTITYNATDGTNPTSQTRTVNVVDTIPPVITLNGSSSMTVDSQVQGSFTDPGATASDACAGNFSATPSGTVDVTKPGTYTLTYNATDGTNAALPVTRTVTVVPVADLSVTQSASLSSVPTGSMLTYSIVVSNAGPQAAQGVSLSDTLPAGTSFVSATATAGTVTRPRGNGSTVSWSVATLASSPSVTLTLVVKVGARAGSTLTNTASVTSSSPRDPSLANNSASVTTAVLPRH